MCSFGILSLREALVDCLQSSEDALKWPEPKPCSGNISGVAAKPPAVLQPVQAVSCRQSSTNVLERKRPEVTEMGKNKRKISIFFLRVFKEKCNEAE